jgi:hypothetical protein
LFVTGFPKKGYVLAVCKIPGLEISSNKKQTTRNVSLKYGSKRQNGGEGGTPCKVEI